MKKRMINDEELIINLNDMYYVVNEYSYNLLQHYYSCKDLEELAKKLNLSLRKTRKIYTNLKEEIDNVDYYDNNIDLDFPLKLQWKVTNKCNLKCAHCYLGELTNKELSAEELMKIATKIANSNIMEVTITGGEALLVKSLPDIVKLLIDSEISVNIFTNAVLLDKFEKELSEKMGYSPTSKLNFFISVDGLEETHNIIRGNGTFEKTMNNIKLVVSKGYKVTTNTVLSMINHLDVPALYEYLNNIGVYKIQISNLIASGNASKDMLLTKELKDEFLVNLKAVLARMDNGRKLLYAEMPDDGYQSDVYLVDKDNKTYLQKEDWKCSAGIGKATIVYNGEVYCCPFMKTLPLGNLVKKELHEVWGCSNRFEFLKEIAINNKNSRVCIAAKEYGEF